MGLLLELFETDFLLLYLLGKASSYKNLSELYVLLYMTKITKIIHQMGNYYSMWYLPLQ